MESRHIKPDHQAQSPILLTNNPNNFYVSSSFSCAFQDAVNRVLALIFNTQYDDNNEFLSPDGEWINYEGESYGDTLRTYYPLQKTLRQFKPLEILQAVYRKMEYRANNDNQSYEIKLKTIPTSPMHYFIGTMDAKVVKFLLDKGQRLDALDKFGKTPIDILHNVIAYLNEKNSPLKNAKKRWPSVEFLNLLAANGMAFDVKKLIENVFYAVHTAHQGFGHASNIVEDLNNKMDLDKEGLKFFAFLLKRKPADEAFFIEKLTDEAKQVYLAEKKKLDALSIIKLTNQPEKVYLTGVMELNDTSMLEEANLLSQRYGCKP